MVLAAGEKTIADRLLSKLTDPAGDNPSLRPRDHSAATQYRDTAPARQPSTKIELNAAERGNPASTRNHPSAQVSSLRPATRRNSD